MLFKHNLSHLRPILVLLERSHMSVINYAHVSCILCYTFLLRAIVLNSQRVTKMPCVLSFLCVFSNIGVDSTQYAMCTSCWCVLHILELSDTPVIYACHIFQAFMSNDKHQDFENVENIPKHSNDFPRCGICRDDSKIVHIAHIRSLCPLGWGIHAADRGNMSNQFNNCGTDGCTFCSGVCRHRVLSTGLVQHIRFIVCTCAKPVQGPIPYNCRHKCKCVLIYNYHVLCGFIQLGNVDQ